MCVQKNELISIIVPVYQVEAYLPACVESVLKQTYSDWELILVDDGSKDDSGELCDQYAQQDSRIKVIHQENGGVSAARNAGLEEAQGEYIAFLDSDDLIKPDYFQVLHQNLEENEADIACCCAVSHGGEILVNDILPLVRQNRVIRDPEEVCADIAANTEIYWSCIWGKLIRAKLAKKYRFRPMRYGEDGVYMFDLFLEKPVIHLDLYEGYYYVYRPTGAMAAAQGRNLIRRRNDLELDFYRLTKLPPVQDSIRSALAERCARQLHNYAYSRVVMGVQQQDKLLQEALQVVLHEKLSAPMRRNMILLAKLPWLYGLLVKVKNRGTG